MTPMFSRDQFVWITLNNTRYPAIIHRLPGERHPDGWTLGPEDYTVVVLCQPDGSPERWVTGAGANELSAFVPTKHARSTP